MNLISDKVKHLFDTKVIKRGCAVRVKRADDTEYRIGLVQEVKPETIRIIYTNIQNGAMSYLDLKASEVAAGMWEVAWTKDLEELFFELGNPPPPPPLSEEDL